MWVGGFDGEIAMRWLVGRLVGVVRSWGLSLCFTVFPYDGVVRLQRECGFEP